MMIPRYYFFTGWKALLNSCKNAILGHECLWAFVGYSSVLYS